MKGVFVHKPPKPRYLATWDVSILLHYLSSLYPLDTLSLRMLTIKAVSLLSLSTAQRCQTLASFSLDSVKDSGTAMCLSASGVLKTSRPSQPLYTVNINNYKKLSICPCYTLRTYILATQSKRKSQNLFISFFHKKAVCAATIAGWIKEALISSGINTDIFKPHSVRGASSSAANLAGLSISEILKTADWKSEKTFAAYYKRDILPSFSDIVLNKM
ncbi:hypothetical protein SNE40_018920 [Patella caerulea]|uniref:Tyr recombinase domain-containing protein n=1 Tax=Patella caerulea TaxID=87958 RepID=A0AAN8P8R7_PATCE